MSFRTQELPAQMLVRALHPYNERHIEVHFARRCDHAFGNRVAAHDAAKDVDDITAFKIFRKNDLVCSSKNGSGIYKVFLAILPLAPGVGFCLVSNIFFFKPAVCIVLPSWPEDEEYTDYDQC